MSSNGIYSDLEKLRDELKMKKNRSKWKWGARVAVMQTELLDFKERLSKAKEESRSQKIKNAELEEQLKKSQSTKDKDALKHKHEVGFIN